MSFSQLLQQARLKFGRNPMEVLSANQPTGETPMDLFLAEEHTADYLALSAGGNSDIGIITGALGGVGGLACVVMTLILILNGKWDGVPMGLTFTLVLFVVPFLWEIRKPLPLPVVLNRRTQEVYFEQGGVLYHTPWDAIRAIAGEFMLVGPQMGGMRCASLEVLMHRFEQPQEQILVSLGLPMGKTLALQKSLWEYIRAYMNNGPWFDENGQHSEFDAYVQSLLSVRIKRTDWHKYSLAKIREEKAKNQGRNYLSGLDTVMLLGNLFFYPMNWVHEFTYSIAKRRSRKSWPAVVAERLRPDGPTDRLIDLEQRNRD